MWQQKSLHVKNLINKINKQVINWGIQYIPDEGLILLQINREKTSAQQKWAPSITDMWFRSTNGHFPGGLVLKTSLPLKGTQFHPGTGIPQVTWHSQKDQLQMTSNHVKPFAMITVIKQMPLKPWGTSFCQLNGHRSGDILKMTDRGEFEQTDSHLLLLGLCIGTTAPRGESS